MIQLAPQNTALVLIDLQQGILDLPTAPRPARDVLQRCRNLAVKARKAGAPVILVHVGYAHDLADAPQGNVDSPLTGSHALNEKWSQIDPDLKCEGDIIIYKRQWGAFTGTSLDLELRRRAIRTIVLAGIATNFGVESTLRQAWELNYDVVVPEDACTSLDGDLHHMAIAHIFPRLGRVTTTDALSFVQE